MKHVDRRKFVKGSAAGIGSVLLLETLQSCVPTEPLDTAVSQQGEEVNQGLPLAYKEENRYSTCWLGKQECSLNARVLTQTINGKKVSRMVKLEPVPGNPRNNNTLCPKGQAQIQAVYDYNRVKTPLKRVNGKGQHGQFVQVSWKEALSEIGGWMQAEKAAGHPVLWQKGRSKAEKLYDHGFVPAMAAGGYSTLKIGHGAFCSDGGYRANEYTVGQHGVLHPDFRHTEYILGWGWNMTGAGGNKLCWITWPQMLREARERADNPLRKVVAFDPNRRPSGPHADEWIAPMPGNDLAFFLGICHHLVTNDYVDKNSLTSQTNSAYLVKSDGTILKDSSDKPLVWDLTSAAGVPFDQAGIKPSLDSSGAGYTVGTDSGLKPAYELFKDHLVNNGYTADWADGICDLPPLTTARIAREMYEAATPKGDFSETITLDGKTFPLRPVSIMAYHVAQHELGFQAVRTALLSQMLLGAYGVPGGTMTNFAKTSQDKRYPTSTTSMKTSGWDMTLKNSPYFPINSVNPAYLSQVMQDPARYGVKPSQLPRLAIIHMTNLIKSFPDSPSILAAYTSSVQKVIVISPWLSETADLVGDYVLPAATIEKYEGPISTSQPYATATTIRMPPVDPLWESKGEVDIYLDLAEAGGFLSEYIKKINEELGLSSYALSTSSKPTSEQAFDAWAKEKGYGGLAGLRKEPIRDLKEFTADVVYPYNVLDKGPYRLYGEELMVLGNQVKATSIYDIAKFPHLQDYVAFPTWRVPTMHQSPSSYDLVLISHKKIEYKQNRASMIALLHELAPRQAAVINPAVAKSIGVGDGDAIWVESHNAITGETRKVQTYAEVSEVIRPGVISMAHHFGLNVQPVTKGEGPTPNQLFFATEGYIQGTQDQSFQVMVRIYKA